MLKKRSIILFLVGLLSSACASTEGPPVVTQADQVEKTPAPTEAEPTASATLTPTPGRCDAGVVVFSAYTDAVAPGSETSHGIYLVCADGSFTRKIVSVDDPISGLSASPDGRKVAFSTNSTGKGGGSIFIIDISDYSLTELYSAKHGINYLSWSASGDYIGYIKWPERGIEAIHLDTLTISQLVSDEALLDFEWAPGGEQMVYETLPAGTGTGIIFRAFISRIECEDTSLKCSAGEPTPIGNVHWDPSWSPDSSLIVSSTDDAETHTLCLLLFTNLDGQVVQELELNALLPGIQSASNPVYSPEGKRIALVADQIGYNSLYLINIDGSGLLKLTDETLEVTLLTWLADISN